MEQATPTGSANGPNGSVIESHQRNYYIALVLSVVVGMLGVDRFYLGKIGTGILKLITGGGFGIWYIVDIVLIAVGDMRDKNGRRLTTKVDLPS